MTVSLTGLKVELGTLFEIVFRVVTNCNSLHPGEWSDIVQFLSSQK